MATVLARFMGVIAGIALSISLTLTVADVILRIFKRPIPGTYELVSLLGAVVIGFAIPWTSRVQGHVLMDFITAKLPGGWQRLLHAITRVLAVALFAIIAWNLWIVGNDLRRSGEVTDTLHFPFYPVAYGIAVCCVVECLVLFVELIQGREGTS